MLLTSSTQSMLDSRLYNQAGITPNNQAVNEKNFCSKNFGADSLLTTRSTDVSTAANWSSSQTSSQQSTQCSQASNRFRIKHPVSQSNTFAGAPTAKTAATDYEENVQANGTIGFSFVQDSEANLIRTPAGRFINIDKFLMQVDEDHYQHNCMQHPSLMNASLYDAPRHAHWRDLEKQVDQRSFNLALPENTAIENFRRFTVMCIFRFFIKWEGQASTIHYAVNNLNRVVIARLMKEQTITQQLYAGVAMACIRMAIKHEDTPSFNRLWQHPVRSLWKHAGFGKEIEDAISLQKINEVELHAFEVLQHPFLTPPSPLDFLDRYLTVGGWPTELVTAYRDLAHYIIDLSLFASRTEGLNGTRPSLLAAAALTLSIKIHNAMDKYEKYEFWPQRLELMTNYSNKRLGPIIKSLAALLRKKPKGEELLAKYHDAWCNRVWR